MTGCNAEQYLHGNHGLDFGEEPACCLFILSAGALAWREEQCRAVHLELPGSESVQRSGFRHRYILPGYCVAVFTACMVGRVPLCAATLCIALLA